MAKSQIVAEQDRRTPGSASMALDTARACGAMGSLHTAAGAGRAFDARMRHRPAAVGAAISARHLAPVDRNGVLGSYLSRDPCGTACACASNRWGLLPQHRPCRDQNGV